MAAEGALEPDDYEAATGPVYALSYAIAQASRGRRVVSAESSMRAWRLINGAGSSGFLGRVPSMVLGGVAIPGLVAGLNRIGLGGQLKADLSGPELRRAALRAMAQVADRLELGAAHVVFGHTHRSGPHPPDDANEWRSAGGAQLINTGSWILETSFLGEEPKRSPYWPGHAVVIDDEGPPRLVRLLEELPASGT